MNIDTIPTDYSGVRFRSKSEAIFARALDISPEVHSWKYEPDFAPRHVDFLIWLEIGKFFHGPDWMAVEYKPSRPSGSYIEHWDLTRAVEIADFDYSSEPPAACIFWGSPFNRDGYGVFPSSWTTSEGHSWDGTMGVELFRTLLDLGPLLSQAKRHRFDLEKGPK